MTDLEEKVRENEEELRILANADCSASWIAQTILERFDMDTMETIQSKNESNEPQARQDMAPTNDSEESVFAY